MEEPTMFEDLEKKRKRKQIIGGVLKASKVVLFITFFYTAWVMYSLGDKITAGIIIGVLLFYLIFNRLEGLEK